MSATRKIPIVNRLLASLPRSERGRITKHCEPVNLIFGTILCDTNEPVRHVYFPVEGFISLVTTLNGHQPLEMGMIGNEGMLGATLALDINVAPLRGLVQGTGSALQMSATDFRRELRNAPHMRRTLHRYIYVVMAQLSQMAACTRFHEIEPRLARWLLMTHDRAHADHFHLTHEFLSDMLGVRRSGITVAAGALQAKNLISYSRGEIRILDRRGLEEASCECYHAIFDDYARLLH